MRGVRARRSPFDIVSSQVPPRTATKAELLAHVRGLERGALDGPDVAFAVACLQDVRFLTPATTRVYEELARRGAQVLVLGRGVHASIAPGVRGVDLADDDPLGDEWTVLLAGRSFTCLAAQDLLEPAPEDPERTFAWARSDDPRVVADAYEVLAADLRERDTEAHMPPYPDHARATAGQHA